MNRQGQAAVEVLARHFSARWEKGAGPHDAFLTIAGRRIALDVAIVKPQRAIGGIIAKPRLRFDKEALRFVSDVRTAVSDSVPDGKALVVTVSAPIRQASKTAAVITEKVLLALARRPVRVEFKETLHTNHVRARLVKGIESAKVIGFVHNPDPGAAELLLAAVQSLLAGIAAGKAKYALAASDERWLLLSADDGMPLVQTWREACSQLTMPADFNRILLAPGHDRIEILRE